MNRLFIATLTLTALASQSANALPPAPLSTLQAANVVLAELADIPLKGIPPAVLADAQGVAIIPNVLKAGFLFGGRGGHGVVLVRDQNGAWSWPVFVDLGGASFGFQAGIESADVVLVFKTRKSLDRILTGRGKLTLGADAAIAAGPIGRQAEAATDLRLQAEIVSYSRSRGLFAGVALDGAGIVYDRDANDMYQRDNRPEVRQLSEDLKVRLNRMSMATVLPAPAVVLEPPLAPMTQPIPQPLPDRP